MPARVDPGSSASSRSSPSAVTGRAIPFAGNPSPSPTSAPACGTWVSSSILQDEAAHQIDQLALEDREIDRVSQEQPLMTAGLDGVVDDVGGDLRFTHARLLAHRGEQSLD